MISVIIPIYNVERYIEQSLMSAFNQTYEDIEYLLVDDCGSDASIEIAKRLIEVSPRKNRIRIIRHEFNKGLSAARNTGMQNAKGDYIFFMDSDDIITADCLQQHFKAIKDNDVDFTVANICLKNSKSIHIKKIDKAIENLSPLQSFLEQRWLGSACNKLYRKDFLIKNGFSFEDGLLHEDIPWSFNIALGAKKICVVEDETYVYNIHDDSITTNKNSERRIKSLIHIIMEMNETLSKGKIPQEYITAFHKFNDFTRLNTSLLLLNYDGSFKQAREFYKEIKGLKRGDCPSKYSLILNAPFELFYLLKPIYILYKRCHRK